MVKKTVAIIGAGIGGLTAALRLSHEGYDVTVFERNAFPGGKLRATSSSGGPVDAGPTVFTLKHLFDELFSEVSEALENCIEIVNEPLIARHFWPDNSQLDLFSNLEKNVLEIKNFAGAKGVKEFKAFMQLTETLYSSFEKPVLRSTNPSLVDIIRNNLSSTPKIINALIPGRTLYGLMQSQFSDIRLRQLFSRYATYVGGSPFSAPAILSLIWFSETLGVWRVKGGMHKLAEVFQELCVTRRVKFVFNKEVSEIIIKSREAIGIILEDGEKFFCDHVIFNGDPKAIHDGALGETGKEIVSKKQVQPRSLSAYVWSFSSTTSNKKLAHHNVFFNRDYKSEFNDILKGLMPRDPTLYVCAQDRGSGKIKEKDERFEIIMNAAPIGNNFHEIEEEFQLCQERTFDPLQKMDLSFNPKPTKTSLTTPSMFNKMFPESGGSLYGLSPQNILTTFRRPRTRTAIKGLHLAGGGVHPGPGVPMAMLSGRHAAEAILNDQISI